MRFMVFGSGAREHALVYTLLKAGDCEVFASPGNPGIARNATCIPVNRSSPKDMVRVARENQIDVAILGDEELLFIGAADELREGGIAVFSPSRAAAEIERSKVFSKELMRSLNVPSADFQTFTRPSDAEYYIKSVAMPQVIKVDGPSRGKGVVVARNRRTAYQAINDFMVRKVHKDSGNTILIEHCLVGFECSVFALVNALGECVVLQGAKDYKTVRDGDQGPNTGGMGSYSPVPALTNQQLGTIRDTIFRPVVQALICQGTPYVGFLYAGLMWTSEALFVLEFNARLGDPETQVLLPRLESSLSQAILQMLDHTTPPELVWSKDVTVGIVLASGGYPGKYPIGFPITGIEKVESCGGLVFHAGTSINHKGELVTNGGRVLTVVARADTFTYARERALQYAEMISFEGKQYRSDIGRLILH